MPSRRRDIHVSFTWSDAYTRGSWAPPRRHRQKVNTMSELRSLSMDPAYPGLDTIAAKPTYLIDGNQFMNRPGPRIVDSLEILAEIMHPELFSFAHEGKGWLRYSG